MPIETTIWNINEGLRQINFSIPDTEMGIEDILIENIEIIDPNLLVIGRQVTTNSGGRIDILALDIEGNVTILELKRDKTPRDIVAQVLDYASWIQTQTISDIKDIFRQNYPDKEIEQCFSEKLEVDFPEVINENHKMIIVSSELDSSTERILNYLTENYGVPINVVFFRYFMDGENKYLSRTWMVDPNIVEHKTRPTRTREPWNQRDFYVAFGVSEHRNWEDARKYGFVSAGQGEWYSRSFKQLFVGARIFTYLPQEGYVGVGIVRETVTRAKDFLVEQNGKMVPILDCSLKAPKMDENSGSLELSEYLVRIDWIKTIPRENAYREVGMFANQNIVCKLRSQFTLDKLYSHFQIED